MPRRPYKFVIYDELPEFNFAQLIEDNLVAYIGHLNYIEPERLVINPEIKPVEQDEEFRKKTTILHMLEKEKSEWFPKDELWHADRVADLKPPAPPGIEQHFWQPGRHLPDMFYEAGRGRQQPGRDANNINFLRRIQIDRDEARPYVWGQAEGNPFRDLQERLERMREEAVAARRAQIVAQQERANNLIQVAWERELRWQLRPLNFFGVRAEGVDNYDPTRYNEVRVPVTLDLDPNCWEPTAVDVGLVPREITVHVREGGLPCVCPPCVRERNEAAKLDHALVDKFRARVMRQDSRPPRCGCYACTSMGRNGLEGCLRHDEPGYAEIEARAQSLLREMLTDSQWECWNESDYFSVMGSNDVIYRIYRMPTYNVLNTSSMIWLCTLPMSERWGGGVNVYPPSDGRVAQMLKIMTDAKGYEEIANHSARCYHPEGWVPPDLVTPNSARRYGARLSDTRQIYQYNNGYRQRLAGR